MLSIFKINKHATNVVAVQWLDNDDTSFQVREMVNEMYDPKIYAMRVYGHCVDRGADIRIFINSHPESEQALVRSFNVNYKDWLVVCDDNLLVFPDEIFTRLYIRKEVSE